MRFIESIYFFCMAVFIIFGLTVIICFQYTIWIGPNKYVRIVGDFAIVNVIVWMAIAGVSMIVYNCADAWTGISEDEYWEMKKARLEKAEEFGACECRSACRKCNGIRSFHVECKSG